MSENIELDLDFVRGFFPGLKNEWVLFDNAGGSQILKPVVERMQKYLYGVNVQHGASYDVSKSAGDYVDEAKEFLKLFINANDSSEIIMGQSTSWLMRMLANSLVKTWQPGDEIIVTNVDHEANISPWVELEALGIVVKTWHVNKETLKLEADELRSLLSSRTQLVAVHHVSNVLGSINDIQEFTHLTHDAGALICVDGVAYAPHRLIDVQETDVDFYAFSCYKVYGPHYALLYGKKSLLLELPGCNHYFIEKDDIPYKFQPGNANFELTYSMLGLRDYFQALANKLGLANRDPRQQLEQIFAVISQHENALSERFLDFLNGYSKVRVLGRTEVDGRVPTFSFVIDNKDSKAVVEALETHKVAIRYGDFYARRLIEFLDLTACNGVIRASLVHYNSVAELDKLIDGLTPLLDD